MRYFFSLSLLLCFSLYAFSQTGRVSGKILDSSSGLPLADFHVFISNTTFQSFSDSTGSFVLTGIPEGNWVIEVRGFGWQTESKPIALRSGLTLTLDFQVKRKNILPSVSTGLSNSRISKLTEEVKALFVGKESKSDQVHFLNPDKLIYEEQADKSLQVSAVGPLFFSNRETGYLISTYFEPFVLGKSRPFIQAFTYFELPEEEGKGPLQRAARLKAYQSSPNYFLAQLMEGKTADVLKASNPEVGFTAFPGDYELSFVRPLQVNLPDGTQGTLDYQGDKLLVKLNGAPFDRSQLILGGVFAELNPVFGVPSNFNAERLIKLANLEKNESIMQERLYLHTDRKHYWPAENIYFKAYLSYGNPLMAEELSSVLHVELFDTTGYMWDHRIVEVKDGAAQGHLSLPDLTETGNFYLRAYTAWSLNYARGEVILPLQILSHQTQPESFPITPKTSQVGVFSNKQTYAGGEKVTLNIMALDRDNKPLKANLSVAVLDLNQASYVPDSETIEDRFEPKNPNGTLATFLFPVEKGFELEGNLLTETGQQVQGSVKAFVNGYEDIRDLKSEKDGTFEFPPSNFVGDFELSLQATDLNARPIRVIKLDLKSYPIQTDLQGVTFPNVIQRGTQPDPTIRPIRSLEAGEILLDEAVVNEKKENSIGPMIYGEPDKVVLTEEMNLIGSTIQFLYALSAQVAGLRIVGSPPNVSVSLRGGEPLVLINGVPANGSTGTMLGGSSGRSVYDVLESVNVFNIERIEVVRRLVPMYGDLGRNGLISIILKSGDQIEEGLNNFTLKKLKGFSPYVPFEKAEESRATYPFLAPFKPTLYWNPTLINDGSRLSLPIEFYLNQKPGPIVVEIRGITELGEPIFGTFLLNESVN